MPSERAPQRYLDILVNILRIEKFTAGFDYEDFVADELVYFAVQRCLSIVSEAAVKLGGLAAEEFPEIPWNNIRGLGNNLRHGYDAIESVTIWNIVVAELAPLKLACRRALTNRGLDPDGLVDEEMRRRI